MSIDQDKLAKVCQMLSSSHQGERAAAAQLATGMLRAAGMSWDDLVKKAFAVQPPQPDPKAGAKPRGSYAYTTSTTKKEDPEKKYGRGKRWVYDGYRVDALIKSILDDRTSLEERDLEFLLSVKWQLVKHGEGCSPKQWVWIKRIARKEGLIP